MHTTSTMSRASSSVAAGPSVAFDVTMAGDGKSDVNVDRGIVLHAEQQATIEASMRGLSTDQNMPKMRINGTFAIVSDLVK
jgi:nitrous oxidase accessory protein NosD